MSKLRFSALGIFVGAALVATFQNCSKVPIEQIRADMKPFYVKGSIDLCLGQQLNEYTVDHLVIANLNIVSSRGDLVVDSDADGIADRDELKMGFDPQLRRSNGLLLDSVCVNLTGTNDCLDKIQDCSSDENILGLNHCEIQTLGLNKIIDHPQQGIDSDKDGMPDLLEILRGINPIVNDRFSDPDHDGVINGLEIQNGTSPIFSNTSVDPTKILKYKIIKRNDAGNCEGELWNITIDQLPFVSTDSYQDEMDNSSPRSPALSHNMDENIVTFFLKIKVKSGYKGNSKIFFKDVRINRAVEEFNFIMDDFVEAGEVLP